ncbi:MAG: T9SS type A sorting domain-containing protein [Bacteroidota bacterium]|nr:T9SS type A sorting domain-containing protein [Bacteroidota bacterium]
MRKNVTSYRMPKYHQGFRCVTHYKMKVWSSFLLSLFFFPTAWANVTVNSANGGTNISADKVSNASVATNTSLAAKLLLAVADASQSTLSPTTATIPADGTSTQVLTVIAKDTYGNPLTTGGATVIITKTSGTGNISTVTDNNDGTYSATVTAPLTGGSGTFTATIDGNAIKNGTSTQTQAVINYNSITITWTGAISADWSTPGNWSNNSVPVSGADIDIPGSLSNYPALSQDATVGNLNFGTDALLSLNRHVLTINGTLSANNHFLAWGASSLVLNSAFTDTLFIDSSLTNLTINNSGASPILTHKNLNIYGTLTVTSGVLNTNNSLTLMSVIDGRTARIATGNNTGGYIKGDVSVQRMVKTLTGTGTSSYGNRRFWFLAAPLSDTSKATFNYTWQKQIHITGPGTGGITCSDGSSNSQPTLNSNGFDASGANINTILYYDDTQPSGSKWTPIAGTKNNNYLKAGDGYRVLIRGDRNLQGCALLYDNPPAASTDVTLSSTGGVVQGQFIKTLTQTAADGFNFIGNPYPSEIDFSAFLSDNTGLNNQYWTYYPNNAAGVYSNYNAGTLTNFPSRYANGGIIASGQSFFIQNGAAPVSSITFNESHKTSTAQFGIFGTGDKPLWNKLLRIELADNNRKHIDEVVIRFSTQVKKSNSYNNTWDSKSLNEGSHFIQSLKENKTALAIQTRNENFVNDTVALNIKAVANSTYQLNFSEFDKEHFADIFLIDRYLNTVQLINDQPTYNFTVNPADPASQGSERFAVIFRSAALKTGSVSNENNNSVAVNSYPNPVISELFITANTPIAFVRMIDYKGVTSLLKKTENNTTSQLTLNVGGLEPGIYMLEVNDVHGNRSVKKIIKQ